MFYVKDSKEGIVFIEEDFPDRLFRMLKVLFFYILVAIFLVAVIGVVSYGALFSLKHLFMLYPEIENIIKIPHYNIDIYLILLVSIFLSACLIIVFISETNYSNGNLIIRLHRGTISSIAGLSVDVDNINNTTADNINSVIDKISALEFSISDELINIKNYLDTIENNTREIKEIQDCISSLENTVESLRD